MNKPTTVTFPNDCRIDLLIAEHNEFIGIGDVRVGGVALRSDDRPLLLRFDTPDGILYTRFVITTVAQSSEGARIEMTALGLPWGRSEYEDEYNQSVVKSSVYRVMASKYMPQTGDQNTKESGFISWICQTRAKYDVKIVISFPDVTGHAPCSSGLPSSIPLKSDQLPPPPAGVPTGTGPTAAPQNPNQPPSPQPTSEGP